MRTLKYIIKNGDCLSILKDYANSSFDLIVTSPPPYADYRAKSYGGIAPYAYVEWFLPPSEQFFRVLKPTGTFILNIKEIIEPLGYKAKKRNKEFTEEYAKVINRFTREFGTEYCD